MSERYGPSYPDHGAGALREIDHVLALIGTAHWISWLKHPCPMDRPATRNGTVSAAIYPAPKTVKALSPNT